MEVRPESSNASSSGILAPEATQRFNTKSKRPRLPSHLLLVQVLLLSCLEQENNTSKEGQWPSKPLSPFQLSMLASPALSAGIIEYPRQRKLWDQVPLGMVFLWGSQLQKGLLPGLGSCREGALCIGFCAVYALTWDTRSGQVRQGHSWKLVSPKDGHASSLTQ